MVLQVPATNRLFVRGLPDGIAEKAVSDLFAKFGAIQGVYIEKEQGCGYVDFKDSSSAEKAAVATDLAISGKPVEARRAMPQVANTLVPPQAIVEPEKPSTNLDVVVIRGACTATAIGLAALLSHAKTTVLVLWNRPSKEEANLSGALNKNVYATLEEERPDQVVANHAFQYYSSGIPKCALVHVQADKGTRRDFDINQPLCNPVETAKGISANHIETTDTMVAASVYKSWAHAYRACFFILLPDFMMGDWPEEVSTAICSTRRMVKADALRAPDGAAWTIGLQMTCDNAGINARLAVSSVNSIVNSDDNMKHRLAGRNVKLTMPSSRQWCKMKPREEIQAPIGIKPIMA